MSRLAPKGECEHGIKFSDSCDECKKDFRETLAALAVARLDRLLGIKSIWGLTYDVMNRYPTLATEIKELGGDVRFHDHIKPDPKGEAIPLWNPPLEGTGDKLFDSHWARSIEGDYCVWHIDYFYSNRQWLKYMQFLEEYLK